MTLKISNTNSIKYYLSKGILEGKISYKEDLKKYLNYKGLKVFDFHPIHIFLNSENMERYNSAREHLQNFEELKKLT